jgi:hypothetical protein
MRKGTTMRQKLLRALLLGTAVVAAVALAACGSDGDSSDSADSGSTDAAQAEFPAPTAPPEDA